MQSLIKRMLTEAPEEITLPSTEVASTEGSPLSTDDFAPAPSPATAPKMPQGNIGASTLKKEVINKEPVLAITSELKSVISTYEKKFEGEDLTVETATIFLNSLLETLAFYAEKIDSLVNSEQAPELPAPVEETPVDVTLPEEEPAVEGDFTAPVQPTAPETTNPLEALG